MIANEIILQLIFTFFVFTLVLWKDNILSRLATVTAIAVTIGNMGVSAINSLNKMAFVPLSGGKITLIIPLILGLLMFTTLLKKYNNLSRPSYSLLIGIGLGNMIRGAVLLNILVNLKASIVPLIGGSYTPLDNTIMIVFVITVISYFLFTGKSRETGAMKSLGDFGRKAIMFGLGTSFGAATITRLTWLGARIYFILQSIGIS